MIVSNLARQQERGMAENIERVLVQGDLEGLTPENRVAYYQRVCESLGLNHLTKPFEYIKLNGKLVLYARRDCTEQLRRLHQVSIRITARELHDGIYVVTASASTADGRVDESTGAVPLEGLKGEARANAFMKAETKAKRRVTLSICGLGILDESEVSSAEDARAVSVTADGEVVAPRAKTIREATTLPAESPTESAAAVKAEFIAMMQACCTEADLRAIGAKIAKSGLPVPVRAELEAEYVRQRAEIRAGAA